jgi:DNA-binding transcriptional LysR family regulator
MEFRTLRAFVEVVRQAAFRRRPGRSSRRSPGPQGGQALEDELGAPLFDRIGPRGEADHLWRGASACRAPAGGTRDLLVELDEIRGLQRGSLRIGLPPVGSARIFAPMLARYRRTYPGIAIELREHGGDRLLDMVRTGDRAGGDGRSQRA